ncbi:hypothetical protein [Sphingobacterium bambusae]
MDKFACIPDELAYRSANMALLHAKSSSPLHTSSLKSDGVSEPSVDVSD